VFSLDEVVPWGRSFDEYRRMFALSDTDLSRSILGCGDGPASFNAEATGRGTTVVSIDPVYTFDGTQIQARIASTCETILEQTRRNAHEFVWEAIGSVEELGRVRMAAMQAFLDDYPVGGAEGRYVAARLPGLPFADRSFDLALCSHLLFLYSRQLDQPFHVAASAELCRVADEVRIFPLMALGGEPSPHVEPVAVALRSRGFDVSFEKVPYEFQKGADRMMRVRQTV
jgi:hypothetical protein